MVQREEPEPYCRICYEGAVREPRANPLVSPCDCRGTLQHVHRRCLLRWALYNESNPETECHLCGVPYRVGGTARLEVIPNQPGLREFVLRIPVALLVLMHYAVILMLHGIAIPYRVKAFCYYATIGHGLLHGVYLALFVSMCRVKNIVAYTIQWLRFYWIVPTAHWIMYTLYSEAHCELGYVADLWLGAYWYSHVQILQAINTELLG